MYSRAPTKITRGTLDGEVLGEPQHLLRGGALATVDGRRDEDEALDERRMPHRDLHRHLGAHRVADDDGGRDAAAAEERRDQVGGALHREDARRLGCLAVARQVDRDRSRRRLPSTRCSTRSAKIVRPIPMPWIRT